jgi:streptogrisin C
MLFAAGLGAVPSATASVPRASPPVGSEPVEAPPSAASAAAGNTAAGGGLSGADLSNAALRDLGLTPDEFAAAGELGKQAAKVTAVLRDVPGYLGTRIEDGSILVSGNGQELVTAVARLQVTAPAMRLEASVAAPPSAAAPPKAVPTKAPADPGGTPAASGVQTGTELAHSTQQLYQDYLREVGPAGLQAVAYTGSSFVIRTGGVNTAQSGAVSGAQNGAVAQETAVSGSAGTDAGNKVSAAQFVSRYANVILDAGARIAPQADVPGGLGYRADTGYSCSTGFSAFDPAGLPSLLTAGHCSNDGAAAAATLEFQGVPAGLLGRFGFSQFGGPGNSPVLRPGNDADPGNVGADIAVINKLRADLDPLPAASTWGDPSEGPDVKVIGSAAPVVGMPVCRSGRTSAWSCGTIDEVGIFVVPGHAYPGDPLDLRAFDGFLSYAVKSGGGDSGGPWISGNYAVGTHSAGGSRPEPGQLVPVKFAVAATLQDSLNALPGYQLEVFLNKPTVTAPAPGATFDAGQAVTGMVAAAPASAVAAGSNIRVTLAGKAPFDVPVQADGTWSFTAPAGTGPLKFMAETVNGFSASGPAAFEFAATPPVSAEAAPPATPPATPPVASPTAATAAEVPAADGAPAPAASPAVVVRPLADQRPAALARTGASGLFLAAGLAAAALAVGGVLLAVLRRRKRQRPTAPPGRSLT